MFNLFKKKSKTSINETIFDERFLSKLSKEDWKKAARLGAEYILEMNINSGLPYDGYVCALIGLITKGKNLNLPMQYWIDSSMQYWIDDVIVDTLKSCPVRAGTLPNGQVVLHPEDTDNLMEHTNKNFYIQLNSKNIFPKNITDIMPIFMAIQSLDEMSKSPKVI